MKDVAKHSGFSIATVSAVINKVPIVSEKTKKKIEESIEVLGYRPNLIAKSLKSANSSSIGVLLKDVKNPHYSDMIYGIEQIAWDHNYEVFLCNTEDDLFRERKYINNLIGKQIDGLIIAAYSKDMNYSDLSKGAIPYLFLNRRPEFLSKDDLYVGADNFLASQKVVEYLKTKGYKKMAFFSGPIEHSTFQGRYEGFINTMKNEQLVINEEWIFFGDKDYSEETGYGFMNTILESNYIPEVIICSSDLFAFGADKALKEKGVQIPKDIALISMDNNRFGEFIGLSSVDFQTELMGRLAGELLIESMKKDSNIESNHIVLEPNIVVRETCGNHLN